MKLQRVKILNFRSIVSLDLRIEDDITTLVGANEHGKSNILRAIALLSDDISYDIQKDKRIDNNAISHCPSIDYYIKLDLSERKEIHDLAQKKYPPVVVKSADGLTTTEKPEKEIKLKDIPEECVYTLFIKEEDDKVYYRINVTDADIKDSIYEYITENIRGRIIYFDEFNDRLEPVISKADIESADSDLIIKGLLKVCELDGKEARIFTDDTEMRQLLDRAPDKITKAVKSAWYQGARDDINIKVLRDASGANLLIDIEDKNTYVDFKARSRGFKWFFSFFLKYRAYHDGDLKDSIFLIDEPGLFLHPKGQKDLLQYIEALGKRNQLIYSTHSPFMVNRLKEKRVRVVEKSQKDGTYINTKGFTANWRHMRTSLGMVLSDSFYFADKTLIVEGPEDVIYILSLLQYFIKQDNLDVDVNLLSIMDSGGAPNLAAMARIVKDEERPLIVLIDSDSQSILNRLKKVVSDSECEEIKSFNSEAVTIQDLLPKDLYEKAVNSYIKKLVDDKIISASNNSTPKFDVKSQSKRDKEVDKFIADNYSEDSISKVGIAREFEEILNKNPQQDKKTFEDSRKLIDWVIKTLKLKT